MNNPMIYIDPSGYNVFDKFFNWVGEGDSNAWNWTWDNLNDFAGEMDRLGISGGFNVSINANLSGNNPSSYQPPSSNAINTSFLPSGSEFYSQLTPGGALTDMLIMPGLSLHYQMHGVDVDMRTGSLMFDDSSIGYDYMWNKSFDNEYGYSVAAREVSGLVIQSGKVVVMPYYKNTVSQSENSYLETQDGFRQVKFNNQWYPVLTHIHTHPQFAPAKNKPIGLSPDDLNLQEAFGRPIFIIYDRAIYSIDGTHNNETDMWNFEEIMIW